jgi:nucleoside-diphosphate-sugar epimerase
VERASSYRRKRVLVTGGLGFIGGNLVRALVGAGARVTVVDWLVNGCGGNRHNLAGLEAEVETIESDIGDAASVGAAIDETDVVFNLAGEISHIHSMRFPLRDAAINVVSQLAFLEGCARRRPGLRIVYAGTRQMYGAPRYLPVDESHPIQAVDFNGIHKYAATAYHLLFSQSGQLDAVALCLTNVYGPRMGLDNPCQGFISNFVRRVMTGQAIEIFGDGRQLRDPVYVDDVVDCFLLAGAATRLPARQYNVGGGEVLTVAHIAEAVSAAAAAPAPVFRPFPEEQKAIDIGSYSTDSSLVRQDFGWSPRVNFETGMARTIEFFRKELPHYLDPDNPNPPCKLAAASTLKTAPAR